MTIHEFGKGNKDVLVMLHPLDVLWDVFEYVIPESSDERRLNISVLYA